MWYVYERAQIKTLCEYKYKWKIRIRPNIQAKEKQTWQQWLTYDFGLEHGAELDTFTSKHTNAKPTHRRAYAHTPPPNICCRQKKKQKKKTSKA